MKKYQVTPKQAEQLDRLQKLVFEDGEGSIFNKVDKVVAKLQDIEKVMKENEKKWEVFWDFQAYRMKKEKDKV